MNNQESEQKSIDTGGGAYVGGNVNTSAGDFVGRDKIVHGDDVRGHKAGGDVIVTTIGAGARNVAAGKNVSQQISEGGATAETPAKEDLDALFDRLMAAIHGSMLAVGQQAKAEARVELLQEEFNKVAAGEQPDGAMIVRVGDWLLSNTPAIAPALTTFFTNAAVRQVTLQAGEQSAQWWQTHFGG